MDRREFLKLSSAGVATILIGNRLSWLGVPNAFAATGQTINVVITDAMKQMATYNPENTGATSYFWIYEMSIPGTPDLPIPAECPGPTICCVNGDIITFNVTNMLNEPHAFSIPDLGVFSGPIAPNGIETVIVPVTANKSGAFLYYDDLNAPVNRMMGLHGALVVRPAAPSGENYTPYDFDKVTPHVQALYDAFGTEVFPGLRWEDGDTDLTIKNPTPPFRQYVWLTHQVSPRLFAEVGNYTAGEDYPAGEFLEKFLRSPFSATRNNYNPEYFTINGQSGFFAHFSPTITPTNRVGEPVVIHILNAGLWTHAMHLHANHFYVTSVDGVVSANPIWVDVFNVYPMSRVDYTIPYMRPPDVPNTRGIGRPDHPLLSTSGSLVWPPVEEFEVHIPKEGTLSATGEELGQRLSPLCYPMHDHSEPSQTAQGGNYNMGLISGMYITGDRNFNPEHYPGRDFPMDEDFAMMFRNIRGILDQETGPAPGEEPVPEG
jgi:FtsP/CotA-like multicopper oxidase with cupredoxin domain